MPEAPRGVLIEGAGIAGQVLRRELELRGIPCQIRDKSSFPRDKVCGGVLQPESWRYLSSVFRVEAEPVPLHRISQFWRARRMGSFPLDEPLVFVPRLKLDHQLWLNRTWSAVDTLVSNMSPADQVRWLKVKASGVAAPEGEWLGFHGSAEAVEGLEMRYGRGIYVGLCEDGQGTAHAAFLVRRALFRNPEQLKELVRSELGVRLDGPIKGTSRIHYGYSGQDLAVGDAKLTTHPFLGLGMKHAILSAQLLARLVGEGREGEYDALHRKAFRRMHGMSRLGEKIFGSPLRALARPFLSIDRVFRFAYGWVHEDGTKKNSGNAAQEQPVSA